MGTEQMAKKHSEQMGIEINGDLGQISSLEKLIGLNGHQGKWAFGENGHLGERGVLPQVL